MNKYILCAMDKSKTEKDLKKNAAAADADDAAYSYDAAAAADAADAAAYAAAAADAADAAADAANNMDYWLNRYFERTGENREDYEKAIKEMEK